MYESAVLRKCHQQAAFIAAALIFGCVMMASLLALTAQNSRPQPPGDMNTFRNIAWVFGFCGLAGSLFMKRSILNAPKEIAPQQALGRLTNSVLVPYAMCEGPVLFGCVVYFLSKNPTDLLMPAVVGVIGFAIHFPRYAAWENWMNNNHFAQTRSS